MQQQPKSVYKTLTWLLLLVVIGMYALHLWYSGVLKDNLAAQQSAVAEHAQRLKESKANLDLAAQTEAQLRGDVQTLTGRLATADQTIQAAHRDMETLRQHDADALATAESKAAAALAAAQKKAAEAYAELQGRFDKATKATAAMGTEIEQLKQTQAETAAAHDAQLTDLRQEHEGELKKVEDKFKGQIAALKTTLQGTDPERATLFASFEERIQGSAKTIADLQSAKTDLTDQLTAAKKSIDEDVRALAQAKDQLQATQAELTQTRDALSKLQAEHDAAMEKAASERAALAKQHADLEAKHAAAMDEAAKQQAALQAQHASAMKAAAKERADLAAAHADAIEQANHRIKTLTASLATETAALAALQTKHDSVVGKLSETQGTLASVKSDLSAAQQAAAEQKAALGAQVAEAKERISTLETTLSTERDRAAASLAAAKKTHADAMAHQHDLLVKVSSLGGKETDQGLLLTLAEADLRFPVARATLPAGDLPSLDHVAELMTEFPKLTARIEGHTDASGREETNLVLSQERADAVKQALVERGVAPERMEAVGLGEAHPIGDNSTKAGSRLNRRVEVYVIEPGQ